MRFNLNPGSFKEGKYAFFGIMNFHKFCFLYVYYTSEYVLNLG